MLPERAAHWVTGVIGAGSRIAAARRLAHGAWHVNHAVDVIDRCGSWHRLVLRRWARPGWDTDDPDYTVEREARVLALLAQTAVPAPEVVAADPDGTQCDVPALLLTRLPGHPPQRVENVEDLCGQLADTLAMIHGLAPDGTRLDPYRLYYDRPNAVPAAWMPATETWKRATAAVRQTPPTTAMMVIHRDYHPGNTLWTQGRLTGVVDWTQASCGPPSLDLGHMRWNLVLDHGQRAADRFLADYRAVTGGALEHQPYWDLVTLLDLLLDGNDPGDIDQSDLQILDRYATTLLRELV